MLKNKRVMAIMLAFVMVFTMLAPAFAVTNNYASSVPRVQADDDQNIGDILIREDADTDGWFQAGDVVTFNLPSGVKFEDVPVEADFTVNNVVYNEAGARTDFDVEVVAAADTFVTIRIISDSGLTAIDRDTDNEARLTFRTPAVEISSGVTGDIRIDIEADGTRISGGEITVGRVVAGNTTTTISKVESIAIDTTGNIGSIRISENAQGVLEADGSNIRLVLPNNYEWDNRDFNLADDVATTGGLEVAEITGWGTRTLEIEIDEDATRATATQPGFINISDLRVYVPDNARTGEIEVTVRGNEVTREDIVMFKVGDFGFSIKAEGDIETVVAGKTDQDVVDIIIDDVVDGSWIDGRTVTLELPSWAEWRDGNVKNTSGSGMTERENDPKDGSKWRFNTHDETGKVELTNITVDIDADAPAGDLVVEIYGSAGVVGEVVIAEVVPPFTITSEQPNFVIGVQSQVVGNITITETEEEALEEGKWVIFRAPTGMYFESTPSVKVTSGDLEIDDEDTDDRYFAFKIDAESAKEASTIEISDIEMRLDRTVPTGDVVFEVFMTTNEALDDTEVNTDRFRNAINNDYYTKVTNLTVGKVTTPAGQSSALFTIGSTIYYVDGVAKFVEAAPYIKGDRTFIPVRAAAEATGAEVEYDEATRTVTATKDGKEIVLVIGQVGASGVAPEIVNDRTFVPIRDLEGLGISLGYDAQSKQVLVQ